MQESPDAGGVRNEPVKTADHSRIIHSRGFPAQWAAVLGAAVVFCADRITKIVMRSVINEGGSRIQAANGPVRGDHGLISVVWHQNEGIIANLPVPMWVIVVVSVVILALVAHAVVTAIRQGRGWQALWLGVLIGGAMGNLYDRIVVGYVFDWILLFGRSAVNLADAGIVAGAVGYVVQAGRVTRHETRHP